MARTGEDVAVAPVDLAIARIRSVYKGWNRDTTVDQMRSDWDEAFGGTDRARHVRAGLGRRRGQRMDIAGQCT